MKHIIVICLSFCGLMSCMDGTLPPIGTDIGAASKVVNFPLIALKGEAFYLIAAGDQFTDPGVNASLAGKPVTPKVNILLDVNKPGIYRLEYTVVNEEGFAATARRLVIVKSATPATPDYSGSWTRNAGARGTSVWVQLTPTTYAVSDPGGAGKGTADYTNYWVEVTVTNDLPEIKSQKANKQISAAPDDINSQNSEAFTGTDPGSTYSWKVITDGFGDALRTFVKQ